MSFIMYHIGSTESIKHYDTERGAKIGTTCSNRNAKRIAYAYAEQNEYYAKVVYKKKVINLLSGQEIEIDSNTPRCCDPSSELYWTM
jgi:hypothetical protein